MATKTSTSLEELRDSWRIQRRVIWALVMREILTRYGRHNIGFLWLFVMIMSHHTHSQYLLSDHR